MLEDVEQRAFEAILSGDSISLSSGCATDTQVVIMDTLRSTITHMMLLGLGDGDPIRVSASATLQEQGVSWEQFVEFVRK